MGVLRVASQFIRTLMAFGNLGLWVQLMHST